MLLGFFTIAIMLAVTYAFWREGLMTAVMSMINVFLSGLIAFNFFEPMASQLTPMLEGSFMAGSEDFLCLILIFCAMLGLLRGVTNALSNTDLEYPPLLLRGGGVLFGLLTGYLVSGFLLCSFATLPLPKGAKFAGYEPQINLDSPNQGFRSLIPSDRVWLALMHRAGAKPFSWGEGPTFDPHGNFLLRYDRYFRYEPGGDFVPNDGALKAK